MPSRHLVLTTPHLRRGRAVVLALLALAIASLTPSRARATYNEWHFTGTDIRVVVDRDAKARVEQRLAVRVVAGSMRSLSLAGYPPDALFEPNGKVTADDGRTYALSVGRDGDAFAQAITQDALKRGDYTFDLVYRIDLRLGRIATDGALSRVSFVAPPLNEGVDGARLVFDLPAAATEPRLALDGQAGVLATLRRTADRDELELVRPHVPRGEAVNWVIRVDPAAISAHIPVVKEAPPLAPPFDRRPFIAVAIALGFAAAWAIKRRVFANACARSGARLSGLPGWLGFLAIAVGVFAAVVERNLGRPVLAGLLIALVTAASVLRASGRPKPRGPGQWVALRAREVFGSPVSSLRTIWWPQGLSSDLLDARTGRGLRVLLLSILVTALSSWWLLRHGGTWDLPWLLLPALIPVFVTGTRADLTPDASRATSVLRGIHARLSAQDGLKVTPWARLPSLADHPDELRLLVMPRAPIPGLFGIEVAAAWERRAGTFVSSAEVLVRVHEDSPASAKMAALRARSQPGRKPEERVFRFEPAWPSTAAAAQLTREWAETMIDRRVQGACIWLGPTNRRAAPQETPRDPANASV